MLTIIVEAILGVFISSFKEKNYPLSFCFIKGFFIGLFGFIFALGYEYFYNNYVMDLHDLVLFFFLAQSIGLIVSIFYFLIEFFLPDKK